MSDIALRFHQDLLVLSAPIFATLTRQGIDVDRDLEYFTLVEPEAVRDALRLEMIAGAQCLVVPTEGITPARLAHHSMEPRASELAAASLSIAHALSPQHILVAIGPCGLPLDASSATSLNENRDQYARAVRLFSDEEFDAIFLDGFVNLTDLKCALMGARQVSDRPLFASVDVLADGRTLDGHGLLEEAVALMGEFGASVAGVATAAPLEDAVALVRRVHAATSLPVLIQLKVVDHAPRQGFATSDNPYYHPDVMVEAATGLRGAGAQFFRATGRATPAYTGALVAATEGLDVVRMPGSD